jgi:hypothetical protein
MGFADLGRDAEIGKWAAEWKGKGMEGQRNRDRERLLVVSRGNPPRNVAIGRQNVQGQR